MMGVFCREQAQAASRVADVAVLTWRREGRMRVPFRLEVADDQGMQTLRVRYAHLRIPRSGFALKLAGSLNAMTVLRRNGWTPDVIHAHEYSAAPVALTLGRLTKAPVVLSEHYSGFALGTLPDRERRRAKWVFEHSRMVCPVSHNLAQHIRELAPRAQVVPVPNVVDTDVFGPDDAVRSSRPPRIVSVGSLKEIKGHRHLIEAIAELRAAGRNITLDVIGDGPLRAELELLAQRAAVQDVVRLRGRQDKAAVAGALRAADIFVLPSLWENLPCAMLEAMSVGLPIVATRVGGVPEVLDADQGIIVEPGSATMLADGISRIIDHLPEHDRDASRAKAVANFSYAAIGQHWARVYKTAMAPGCE